MPRLPENGQLAKLRFTAYRNSEFTRRADDIPEYSVMFNPETISVKLEVERDNRQGAGTTASSQHFRRTRPQDYRFEFVVDGTGVTTGEIVSVPQNVENFLRVVYDYNSEDHRPNYVMIRYGAVLLKAVLKSVDITYNLFSPNGTPLRAKISTLFASCLDPNLSEMINSPSSPDLTHKRVVKEQEKLVTMACRIYGSNRFYQEVARANNLDSFREIDKGREIWFPPIRAKNVNPD